MSQQYPGQPAGTGGMPPGYGGPPPGAPVPGQGSPNMPPPSKNQRLLLIAGIGCGLVLLLGIAAVVAGVFWLKGRGNAALDELQRLQGSVASSSSPGLGASPSGEPTGDCLLAYRCCQAIAGKSPAVAAAASACEVFKTPAYPQTICVGALTGYRKVAEQTGIRCE